MKTILIVILLLTTTQLSAQNFYEKLDSIRGEHRINPLKKSFILSIESKRWAKKCVKKYNSHLMHDVHADFEVISYNVDPFEAWMNSPSQHHLFRRSKLLLCLPSLSCFKFKYLFFLVNF